MNQAFTDEFDAGPLPAWRKSLRRITPIAMYAIYGGVAALTIAGIIPAKESFLALSGSAAIGIIIIALGFRRHYTWAHTNCAELDEREQRARARAYEVAYGAIITAGFLFFGPPLLIQSLAEAPNSAEIMKSAVFGFMLLASTLPTAVLAWRDRGDAIGGVGKTGRISRRTQIFWAICGAIGLAAGFTLGFYS
jgi:hypothetical protein